MAKRVYKIILDILRVKCSGQDPQNINVPRLPDFKVLMAKTTRLQRFANFKNIHSSRLRLARPGFEFQDYNYPNPSIKIETETETMNLIPYP